jgi:tetratricopeptide (TPR) repeat protein
MRGVARFLILLFCFGLAPGDFISAGETTGRVSERTYKQLSRVHELMQKQRYGEAIAGLDRMKSRVKRKPYERALVLQTYGYIYARQDQYRQAIDALEACLALKVLPRSVSTKTRYTLAQLQLAVADYPAAVSSLEQWFKMAKEPTAEAHGLAGAAYAQTNRYGEAAVHLKKAIALASSTSERWYRQLLAVYYHSGEYAEAASLLQQMVVHFPRRKDYWIQMSSLYRELGKESQALAALKLAYDRGLITEEEDLLRLVHHYRYMGLPHKAGSLLSKGLREAAITPTVEHWELLTDIWIRARETDLALAACEKALQKDNRADIRLKQAQLLAIREKWSQVIDTAESALKNPGLSSPGVAHLLKGIAHYQLQQVEDALASFREAAQFDASGSQANQWIRFISSTQQLEAQDSSLYLSQRQQ